jgi:hypothetical protein
MLRTALRAAADVECWSEGAHVTTRTSIKAAIAEHTKQGRVLLLAFAKAKSARELNFHFEYQEWYSKALPLIRSLAPDRYDEFRRYYEPDPKRKSLGHGTYVIQDFLKGVVPNKLQYSDFDARDQAGKAFLNQIAILASIHERLDSVLSSLEAALFADLKDSELTTAQALLKVSPRAAGAVAGVVLEAHLQRVVRVRGLKILKKAPTIGDLNDLLRKEEVYDTVVWRKIAYLGDIRNLCSHRKTNDPTHEQVVELIRGVNWTTRNVE